VAQTGAPDAGQAALARSPSSACILGNDRAYAGSRRGVHPRFPDKHRSGRALYVEHCAACHGVDLEGQPDWRSPDANGLYPAPPHDETGHTWHHDDEMLIDYITRGGQAVLDDMGVTFTSGMPGFGSVLEESGIEAILDYIKSTWPAHIRDAQAERTSAAAGN
jgi:mono/diheme cytochrome c family protein